MKSWVLAGASASILAAGMAGLANAGPIGFPYTGSPQNYAIDQTGEYQIVLGGAAGGTGDAELGANTKPGGNGVSIGGDILLQAGSLLDIIVGGQGQSSNPLAAGGGGGSFVYLDGSGTLLGAAGGGGGGGVDPGQIGGPGLTGPSGGSGGGNAGSGGTDGMGGQSGQNFSGNGGGGAGFLGNGGSCCSQSGEGGSGPPTFAGGTPGAGNSGNGGFGGGGGAGRYAGGGGGGYSGGGGGDGAGDGGGGGGSFLTTTYDGGFDDLLTPSADVTGDGYVSITYLGPSLSDMPEPGTAGLLYRVARGARTEAAPPEVMGRGGAEPFAVAADGGRAAWNTTASARGDPRVPAPAGDRRMATPDRRIPGAERRPVPPAEVGWRGRTRFSPCTLTPRRSSPPHPAGRRRPAHDARLPGHAWNHGECPVS